jgi:uncharacterized membrane protein YeiH
MTLSAALDYLGTLTFAIGGASIAVRRDTDLFGVFVIALVAGCGGGIIRDVLLGATPPRALDDPVYLLLAAAATVFVVVRGPGASLSRLLVVVDALGLAFFATAGALIALQAGTSASTAVLLGAITAVGGGILRDLLTARMPAVLHSEIYATAALLAAVVLVVGVRSELPLVVAVVAGVISGATLRLVAWKAGWRLAVPR